MEKVVVGWEWILGSVAAVAALIGGLRMRQTGTHQRLLAYETSSAATTAELKSKLEQLAEDLANHRQESADRLARVETKIDVLLTNRK